MNEDNLKEKVMTFEEWASIQNWEVHASRGYKNIAMQAWHAGRQSADLAQARIEAGAAMAKLAAGLANLDHYDTRQHIHDAILALASTDALAEVVRKAKLDTLYEVESFYNESNMPVSEELEAYLNRKKK